MQGDSSFVFRVAGWSAYAGAVVSAIGIVFLVALYIGLLSKTKQLEVFGPLNDLCVLIQNVLAVPITVALYLRLRPESPRFSLVAMLIGLAGMIAAAYLQYLLISGAMSFEEQVGLASVALLVVGSWIVMTGVLGRRTGKLRNSVPVIIAGALYFGYPVWAYRVGQQLLSGE